MRFALVLITVFLFGLIVSAACATVVLGALRLFGLAPQTDMERAAQALFRHSRALSRFSFMERAMVAIAASLLPFSISAALGVASILPNAQLRPALSLLREEAKEQPIEPDRTNTAGPPDAWSAFGEVERDVKIAGHYLPRDYTISSALLANSANRFSKLLRRGTAEWSDELKENVIAVRGFNGAIRRDEVEGIYVQLANTCKALPSSSVGTKHKEALDKLRLSLDELRA